MTRPSEQADHSKRRSRGWSNDMDGQAISRRLAIVEQLYSTWLVLQDARPKKTPPPSVAADTMPTKPSIMPDTRS
jgi:hypothetical protein